MMPLAIDLCCGLGGWAEELLAEGWDVVGFDIERHQYGEHRYPAQLVVQDVLTLHGSQFRDADLIVASPPCQTYSWMAMPWTLAKAKATAIRADTTGKMLADLNRLFDACFRIQVQASMAAGRHIPMIVENVRGAQPWVGRARWNFGSFYLWGDVPALMPSTSRVQKFNPDGTNHGQGSWFAIADSKERGGHKIVGCGGKHNGEWSGFAVSDSGVSWRNREDIKNGGGSWFNVAHNTASGKGQNPDGRKVPERIVHVRDGADHARHLTNPAEHEGIKCGGDWFNAEQPSISRLTSSKSTARKAASAMIAKIPAPLARHIAVTFRP